MIYPNPQRYPITLPAKCPIKLVGGKIPTKLNTEVRAMRRRGREAVGMRELGWERRGMSVVRMGGGAR